MIETTKRRELRCKQYELEQCIKKMQDEREYLNDEIVLMWSNLCVIATPPSSMYSPYPHNTNDIGQRFAEARYSISSVEHLHKSFVAQIDIYKEQMNHLKWYNIKRKHKLSDKIASHRSDVRLLSLLIERYYERSDDVSAIIEKKRIIKELMKRLHERKQHVIDELHKYKLSRTFDECDELCADDDKSSTDGNP